MVEALRKIPLSELRELRKTFGPGTAGKEAFRIIAKGAICEGFKNDETRCENAAILTIDFDVPRINVLEHIPSCGDCRVKIEKTIFKDCSAQGNTPSFGINGMGRA
ncbi:MAG: hypothetical protein Q8P29_01925 [Candidatus Levybacteria bacterium]|nr:hypothetical protein [Candidatus Levybacteria bacterium]MDZ4228075.1 hypothetical protein [Candidatus Levybacteria bacterium]